jgi:membrane associated rhomboid family serine protease
MGESDRYGEYPKQPRRKIAFGDDNNALIALFAINVLVLLILLFIKVSFFFFQKNEGVFETQVLQYFSMPASLGKLSQKPWTVLLYMFSDISVLRLLSNMLWLWAFGYILQDITGNRKLIPIYIYGGLSGAVFFVLANYLIPSLKPFVDQAALLGANAGTMAVAVATTTLVPEYRFFRNINRGIPIWILTLIYILIDFAGVAGMGAAYSLSHLGGALAGILFVVLLNRGIDGSAWMNKLYHWFANLFTPPVIPTKNSIKEKVFYNADNRQPYKKTSNVTQQRVDEILDKINQQGYRFLTDEEKNILKRASEDEAL